MPALAQRTTRFVNIVGGVLGIINDSEYSRHVNEADISDFMFGNPHEMPLPQLVGAMQRQIAPQRENWFAYRINEPEAIYPVAEALRERYGWQVDPHDILMTTGGFAGIAIALYAITDPGDEVIFVSPPWFFHEPIIVGASCTPVRVKVNSHTFDLDLEAISAAITPKTRAIIINSPHNPTGVVYSEAVLRDLAALLTQASEQNGRPIYAISDEAYRRILFDDVPYASLYTLYPNTLVVYTYGKQLLAPGQRVGYIAIPSNMPERENMRNALLAAQLMTGYTQPNAIMQYAMSDLEKTCIDLEHLQYKRDWMLRELREIGYDVHTPQGTFYLLPRSPLEDDLAFCELLNAQRIYCLPGSYTEIPGYFRISLTANDAMIERSFAGLKTAFDQATATRSG